MIPKHLGPGPEPRFRAGFTDDVCEVPSPPGSAPCAIVQIAVDHNRPWSAETKIRQGEQHQECPDVSIIPSSLHQHRQEPNVVQRIRRPKMPDPDTVRKAKE